MAITAALPLSFEKRIKIEQRTDYGTKCLAQNPVDALDDLRINVELERTGAGPDAFSSCSFKAAMAVLCLANCVHHDGGPPLRDGSRLNLFWGAAQKEFRSRCFRVAFSRANLAISDRMIGSSAPEHPSATTVSF